MLVRIWSNRNSHSLLVGMQNDTATLEESLAVSYQTKPILNTQSSNCAPWYLPKLSWKIISTKTWTGTFIAALFIIARTWKQPKCPSVGEWIKKLWYTQTMDCYSALKRNELSRHEKTWQNLKCILLSERTQSDSTTYCMISIIRHSRKGKTMERVKSWVIARG